MSFKEYLQSLTEKVQNDEFIRTRKDNIKQRCINSAEHGSYFYECAEEFISESAALNDLEILMKVAHMLKDEGLKAEASMKVAGLMRYWSIIKISWEK